MGWCVVYRGIKCTVYLQFTLLLPSHTVGWLCFSVFYNNNLFINSALFNMLGDQKRITTINNLKTINTNIKIIQTYLLSKRY